MASMSIRLSVAVIAMLCLVAAVFAQDGRSAETQASPAAKKAKTPKVAEWFTKYGEIRHHAQMSPQEKEKSGQLLTQGLAASVFKGPDAEADTNASKALLQRMVDRYTKAIAEMDQLQAPAETKKLHLGYRQYFTDARALFADYLKIQGNLFATDSNGNSILGQLQTRKAALESLDVTNKDLDAKLRAKFNIAAYPY